MNSIRKVFKQIATGLTMQYTADYLSSDDKHSCMKKAVANKQCAIESVAKKELDEVIFEEPSKKIDFDTAILTRG